MSSDSTVSKSKDYKGSCHCGKITFTVTLSPPLEDGHEVSSCNCSICSRNGYLAVYPKDEAVVFHSGQEEASSYSFNTMIANHRFCPTCGTSIWIEPSAAGSFFDGKKMINIRTLQDLGIDIDTLKLKKLDGKKY